MDNQSHSSPTPVPVGVIFTGIVPLESHWKAQGVSLLIKNNNNEQVGFEPSTT